MDREQLAVNFKEEYERLCDKYGMEIDVIDRWGDETFSCEIYDREQKVYILDIM